MSTITSLIAPFSTRACAVACVVIVSPAAANICTGGAAVYPEPPLTTVKSVTAPPLTVAVICAPAPGPYTSSTASSKFNASSNLCNVAPFV